MDLDATDAETALDAYRAHRASFTVLRVDPDSAVAFLAACGAHVWPTTAGRLLAAYADRWGADLLHLRHGCATIAGHRGPWIDRRVAAVELFGAELVDGVSLDLVARVAALTIELLDEVTR